MFSQEKKNDRKAWKNKWNKAVLMEFYVTMRLHSDRLYRLYRAAYKIFLEHWTLSGVNISA